MSESKAPMLTVKRFMCFILLLAMIFNFASLYLLPVLSAENDSYITLGGERTDELYIENGEKVNIYAVCDAEPVSSYVWQIRYSAEDDRWVNISGANSDKLAVSYPLISSLLDSDGKAYIRCVMKGYDEHTTDVFTVYATSTYSSTSAPVLGNTSLGEADEIGEEIADAVSPDNATESGTETGESTTAKETEDKYTTHSIVINYIFDNNAIAFEPYGASVAHGSAFKETVNSPVVVGYAPFRRVGEDYIDATKVEFNIASVTENITINVIYEPALVEFSIHHHQQNLYNDDYSLSADLITKSYALTGSTVPAGLALTESQLPGFNALSYERLTVAADGSTVVEIRYDRKYYLVDFDMNGGYGTDPTYTRYGDDVGANTPIRHGYVFDGWELISYGGHAPTEAQKRELALASGTTIEVPAANIRYKARWKTTETTYTMVFWQENANDDGYTYWGHLDSLGALSGSLVDGRDIISQVAGIEDERYFTFNENRTDKNVIVEGDGSTVVNVYYTRNYYKLTIKATGKCTIPEGHVHTDACYDYICGNHHIHSEECTPILSCELPLHTAHTSECLKCDITEHTHTIACTCDKIEHTHSKSCWSSVGNKQNKAPDGAPSNPENGYVYRKDRWSNKYIYVYGTWYRYTGLANSGDIADPACDLEEHTHTSTCDCPLAEHTHGLGCYSDTLHEHGDDCYTYSCGKNSHEDESSCMRLKCGVTESHKHSMYCNSASSTNVVAEIYRKYGQSIEDIWPIVDGNGKVYDNGERWKPTDSSYYTQVLVYLTEMTPDSFTLTLDKASYTPYTMNYYLEVLKDENPPAGASVVTVDEKKYYLDNTIKAKYNYVTKAEDFFDIKGFKQYKSNPSFSSNGQISLSGNKVVNFYYDRNEHSLYFNNNGTVLDNKTVAKVQYGALINEYSFTPDYPTNLEPGAFEFAGWYTSPGCFAGTEVDWSTQRMPDGDLLLYAKWVPIKHTVRVWLDNNLTERVGEDQIVDHGSFAKQPVDHLTNGNYVFQGWFYTDIVNGATVEKAFNFTGIPVMRDMDIYAKWGSHVSVDYKINYVLSVTKEPIADPTTGSALAGNNKTFEAKAGADLYEGFRSGYYPLVNSHTITMSVDGTHEFTFEYVFVPSMPYKVRYINAQTGQKIMEDKVVRDNTLSVVTETFIKVNQMMPDAYQKRLVLSANDVDNDNDGIFDDNVITFYYNFDEVHAYYKVVHYIHAVGTDEYREYRSVETVGVIGQSYTIDAVTLSGFAFNGAKTKVNGVLTPTTGSSVTATLSDQGMLVELYYDRLPYNYKVEYLDAQTKKPIISDKSGVGLFGEQIIEYALDLGVMGYTLQNDSVKMISISANQEHNVITFLYSETNATIKYHIVGPQDSGMLSITSENLGAISGVPNGSTPTANQGFLFVGWFVDEYCTTPASSSMIGANNKLVPTKGANDIWASSTEFYAKFIPKETKLTVICTGADPRDAFQSFIFTLKGVEGTESEGIEIKFNINGNGHAVIAGLPLGEYTVSEIEGWSWRYDAEVEVQSITLVVDADENKLIFDNSRKNGLWLDGNAGKKNIF